MASPSITYDPFKELLDSLTTQPGQLRDKWIFRLIDKDREHLLIWREYTGVDNVDIRWLSKGLNLTLAEFLDILDTGDKLDCSTGTEPCYYNLRREEDGSLQIWPE